MFCELLESFPFWTLSAVGIYSKIKKLCFRDGVSPCPQVKD